MLRAGLTEVLVTGMLMRWMSVRPRSRWRWGQGHGRGRLSVEPRDDHQKHQGHDHFAHEGRLERMAAEGVQPIAVGSEPARGAEPRPCPRRSVENAGGGDAAQDHRR